jgi:hypothetical protein
MALSSGDQSCCSSIGRNLVDEHRISAAALSGPSADNNLRDASHGRHLPVASAADPVFIAIEQHRQAARALSAAYQMPDALLDQLQRAEEDALLAWLTAAPITMAGVIATLEHASRRPYVSDYPYDYVYANLAESAQCSDDILLAGEQFPLNKSTKVRIQL